MANTPVDYADTVRSATLQFMERTRKFSSADIGVLGFILANTLLSKHIDSWETLTRLACVSRGLHSITHDKQVWQNVTEKMDRAWTDALMLAQSRSILVSHIELHNVMERRDKRSLNVQRISNAIGTGEEALKRLETSKKYTQARLLINARIHAIDKNPAMEWRGYYHTLLTSGAIFPSYLRFIGSDMSPSRAFACVMDHYEDFEMLALDKFLDAHVNIHAGVQSDMFEELE